MKIAAAAYPIDWLDNFDAYEAKITRWVEEASECDLLVFPEYGAMELAGFGEEPTVDLNESRTIVARHGARSDALHERLARRFELHILAGSAPAQTHGRWVNRATLFGPDGVIGYQDKQIMTLFEQDEWQITSNPGLRLFDTAIGRLGVLICYDSEFPLLGRVLAEAGAEIILVPSTTETVSGFTRVRTGAMARALESQCIVVHAPLVGTAAWCEVVSENHGRASIYAPADGLWPETGIVAEGAMNEPGWVKAQIDRERITRSRTHGAVRPYAHWPASENVRLLADDEV